MNSGQKFNSNHIDHTLLKPEATDSSIEQLCLNAKEWGTFGVCVNSSRLSLAKKTLAGSTCKSVVVIGFPLGAMSTESKVFEAKWCQENGADEIDMVIPVGHYLGGDLKYVENDITSVVKSVGLPVKVIIETGFLEPKHITDLTKIVGDSGAAFIKTSTGFGPRGATVEDVVLMDKARKEYGFNLEIKAAGGVSTPEEAQTMIDAGATRIGTSRTAALLGITNIDTSPAKY